MNVSISRGNEKMGAIQSVSLPSGVTCIVCGCNQKCYAKRMEKRRRTVREAYQNNLKVLNEAPEVYWREVEAAVMLSRYFRFHVSGDIPDSEYFTHMVELASRNKHCQILCFTKKYAIVNAFLSSSGGKLPGNLHIIFSGWAGLLMVNPFSLPEAHVRYRDGSTTAAPFAKECTGNCTDCAVTDAGCWTLKPGEQVVFNEH